MKRAPLFVLAGTVAGFAGMLSFHTRPGTSGALAGPASQPSARSTASPATGHSDGSRRARAARKRAGATAGTGQGTQSAGVRATVGALEQYSYGELAVKVTVHGNRITSVTVPTLQTAEPYSQQLAVQVIPQLRSEVLAGQTAHINGVSGATYTSEAYATSLQAALDKLHVR